MSAPTYTLHAWHVSYFSGKTRAYLRYKGIPFVDNAVNAWTLLREIPRRTGAQVIPVVVTPEGEWLQDSKHICDVLEQRFPEAPVLPATPRQRIAALLIEAWADEYWIPAAMHYRWSYPENYALFESDGVEALIPRFVPRWVGRRLIARVANTLRSYLPAVGVVPAQHATMERWTEHMLDALERHFITLPFLFGSRPSVADFGLLGPMYAHLGRDPWPKRHLVERRPHLKAWIDRMNAPQVRGGKFLEDDAIPPTLQPLLDSVFREFQPMVAGIRAEVERVLPGLDPQRGRLPRMLGTIEFPMGAERFRRGAMPYTLWMAQRIVDQHRALDSAARASVDHWLTQQKAPPIAAFDPGLRLERAGLHVRVAR